MKVSVVIPTYYRSKDLSELFDSLLNQTIKPLEVIVIDDAPTDVIKEVCETNINRFRKFNINLIYIRNYKEPSSAVTRNIGSSIAKGDVILFLDSDVILYPDYIDKVLDVFRKNQKALGVQGWIVLKIKRKRINYFINTLRRLFLLTHFTKDSCRLFEYPLILTRCVNCEVLGGSNMAVKRDILREFRFDENLKKYSYMEDVLFSYSIHKNIQVVYI